MKHVEATIYEEAVRQQLQTAQLMQAMSDYSEKSVVERTVIQASETATNMWGFVTKVFNHA